MFRDRFDAAMQLAKRLEEYRHTNGIILAVPRGGVPIGYLVARHLGLVLDVILSKKIGHPYNSELAIGSVSLHGTSLNKNSEGVPSGYIHTESERILETLKEKHRVYAGHIDAADLEDKTVIVVDDGIATGSTMLATIDSVKKHHPAKIIVAAPVASPVAVSRIEWEADKVICLATPPSFRAVGQFYKDFSPVSDEEVIRYLRDANQMHQPDKHQLH